MTTQTPQTETTTNTTNEDPQAKALELYAQLQAQGISLKDLRDAKKQLDPKTSNRKYDAVDFSPLTISLAGMQPAKAWTAAQKHVDMPMQLCKGVFQLSDENGNATGKHLEAVYDTDSGRNGQYYFVAVDRWKDGTFRVLSPVSEMYCALPPATVYQSLKESMSELKSDVKYELHSCYNSYSGGRQTLELDVTSLKGADTNEDITMRIVLHTSLDRSKNHILSANPVASDGTPIFFQDSKRGDFGLVARHVTSAANKAVEFNTTIAEMVNHWNSTIMPRIRFLRDGELNEKDVALFLKKVMADAKLPKQSVETIEQAMKQNKTGTDAYAGVKEICAHINAHESPISRERQAEEVGKAISKRVGILLDKKIAANTPK